MSVSSTAFGAVRLTKKDAKKFRAQVTFGRPKQAAKDACARGKEAAAEYINLGYAVLNSKRA